MARRGALVIEREELVVLLRMAADTSGHPLTTQEASFLDEIMRDCGIDADSEGVVL